MIVCQPHEILLSRSFYPHKMFNLPNLLRATTHFFSSLTSVVKLCWSIDTKFFVVTTVLTIIQGVLPLGSAWVVKLLIDLVAESIATDSIFSANRFTLLVLMQVSFVTLSQLLPLTQSYARSELERRISMKTQSLVYRKINSFTELTCFETPNFYDSIQLAQDGAQNSTKEVPTILFNLTQTFITFASFVGVIVAFEPLLAVLIVCASIPQLYTQFRFSYQRFKTTTELNPQIRRTFFYSMLLSSTYAAKEVRLYNLGDYFLKKLLTIQKNINDVERNFQIRELRWQSVFNILQSAVTTGALVVVLLQVIAGRLTLGDVTLYISAVASVQGSLGSMILNAAHLNESSLFFSHFDKLMNLPSSNSSRTKFQPTSNLANGIEFQNVSFRYSKEHPWVLKNLNLYIPQGSCVGLVGANGSGKTTLVKLLTKLYTPTEGRILWDGTDIDEFEANIYRRQMGAIFQDFSHYDLTVQENIGIGDIEKVEDLEQVKQAASLAGIHNAIESLPLGYKTLISVVYDDTAQNTSVYLSGGEWQKIAMARMYMRKEVSLLVLDEPTSALDPQAEHEIYSRFAELTRGKTSLLISHRLSAMHLADIICVLEDGKIVENGSHEELLRTEGRYAKLYNLQAQKYT